MKHSNRRRFTSLVAGVWLFTLGMASLTGSDFSSELKKAEAGDAEAQFFTGRAYDRGEGVPQDYAKARAMYEKAAAQGNAKAMNNLGSLHLNGRGMPKDTKAAVEWFKKSAEHGADRAQFTLGACLQEGLGMERNLPEAVEWFERAASQGNVDAQRRLVQLFYDGAEDMERDYAKAASLVKPLAEAGDPWAMNFLGVMHEFGYGVARDDSAALQWMRKAAEKGDGRALFNLGSRYASGQGVPRDIVHACVLLELSLKKGEKVGVALLTELKPTLTSKQHEEVTRQVNGSPTIFKTSP